MKKLLPVLLLLIGLGLGGGVGWFLQPHAEAAEAAGARREHLDLEHVVD